MGSKRLPGKVLLRICGQSVLERCIRRLRAARSVDEVVVLTSTLEEDNRIAEESLRLGTLIHRGPEQDVLKRFQEAAEEFRPNIIIRATADNPLIDMGSVERIVHQLRLNNLDWCIENELPYGSATEAFTRATLSRVHIRARQKRHREHVTLYIKEHPQEFLVSFMTAPKNLRYPQLRLTIDTPEDFIYIEELIRQVPDRCTPPPLERYVTSALTMSAFYGTKELAASGR